MHREINCPACGTVLFVLPRNARPRPVALDAASAPRRVPPRANATPAESPTQPEVSRRELPLRGLWHKPAEGSRAERKLARQPFFTRGRMRLLLAGAAALLAIGLAWHHRRQSHYDLVLKVAAEEAQQALAAGDYLAAAEQSRAAAEAARILGDDSPRGLAAMQLEREANVWARLALTPLDTLVDILDRAAQSGDPIDAASIRTEFERLFAGRTILVDAWVSRESPTETSDEANGSQTSTSARLEWMLVGESSRVGIAPLAASAFDRLDADTPTHVLFGCELQSIDPPSEPSGSWTLQVRPSTVTLLTEPEPFVRANWPAAEPLEPILDQQRVWIMGDSP